MSVAWAKIRRDRTWSDTDKPERKAERTYLVKCTDKTDDPSIAAAVCPAIGTAYSGADPGMVAISRDADYHDSTADGGVLYEVKVQYTSKNPDPSQKDPDPLARPALVALSFDTFEQEVYEFRDNIPDAEDSDGNVINIDNTWKWFSAVVNSAGAKFDPGITDTYRDPVLTVTKNLAALPFNTAIEWVDTINSDTFTITYRGNLYTINQYQAWLFDINTSPEYENGVYYERCTYVFKLRKDGWKRKVLDQGLSGFDGDDPSAAHPAPKILDKNSDPIQEPALLDGKGSAVGSQGAGTKPAWLKFRLKKVKDFSSLTL